MFKNEILKLFFAILIVFFGINMQVLAENPPIPSSVDIQSESNIDASNKVQVSFTFRTRLYSKVIRRPVCSK